MSTETYSEGENPEEIPYMLALFDVLGFSDWLERTSLKQIVTI